MHHPAHPFLTDPKASVPQLTPDPRPSIGTPGFGMDRLDVGQQGHVTDASPVFVGPFLTVRVLVKSPGADIQDRTLYRDRPVPAVSLNKGVLHRDSLAKYAAAFLRNSPGFGCGGFLQNVAECLGAPLQIGENTLPVPLLSMLHGYNRSKSIT